MSTYALMALLVPLGALLWSVLSSGGRRVNNAQREVRKNKTKRAPHCTCLNASFATHAGTMEGAHDGVRFWHSASQLREAAVESSKGASVLFCTWRWSWRGDELATHTLFITTTTITTRGAPTLFRYSMKPAVVVVPL